MDSLGFHLSVSQSMTNTDWNMVVFYTAEIVITHICEPKRDAASHTVCLFEVKLEFFIVKS